MKLDGKVALVTGGASGIGKATVMELARCDATVVCVDVNAEKGAELAEEAARTNFAVEFVAADLADVGSIERCVAGVLATDTPMLQSRPDKPRKAFIRAIPFRRFAKPQGIADAVLFFAGPRSDYITGQVLSVSGGLAFAG